MAAAFYLLMDCVTCDEEMHYGVVLTTLEHEGLPAISCDLTSQIRFDCDNCGGTTYTGDFRDNAEHEEGTAREDDAAEDAEDGEP